MLTTPQSPRFLKWRYPELGLKWGKTQNHDMASPGLETCLKLLQGLIACFWKGHCSHVSEQEHQNTPLKEIPIL